MPVFISSQNYRGWGGGVVKVEEKLMDNQCIYFTSILTDKKKNKGHTTIVWNFPPSWIANIRQIISHFYDEFYKGKAQYEINTKQKCKIW